VGHDFLVSETRFLGTTNHAFISCPGRGSYCV
jgi:hypothetical protein